MTLISWFKIFLIFLILILFPFGINSYVGNKFYYIIFTIISSYALIFSFNKNSISFESFFSLLLWLGFWFKFTIQISFLNSQFPEGAGMFNHSSNSYNQVLIISTIGILGFLLAKYVRSKYIFNYDELNKDKIEKKKYLIFYSNFRKQIIFVYCFLIIFFPIINLIFVFFQKGTIPQTILPLGLNNFINWLLMFGLASLSSIIIFFEFFYKNKNSNKIVKIGIFENFFSSLSVLSRAMIFNSTSLVYGYYRLVEMSNMKVDKIKFFKFFIIIMVMFSISLVVVSKLRQVNDFPVGHQVHSYIPQIEVEETQIELIKKPVEVINDASRELNQIIFLIAGRWVGIEGVMTVYSNKNMGWSTFKLAFKDEFNFSNSFYENFVKGSKHTYKKNPKIFTVYVPGIIGFLYYTNSLFFLFFCIFILCIICSYIELFAYKISKNNIILSYLIGNVLAYRLAHFGYMPQNTYKILLAILLNFLLIIVMYKLVDLFYKK